MIAAGSPIDPFRLEDYPSINANRDVSGKTLKNTRPSAGVGVFICAGQSNICNTVDTAYSITNPTKVDNLNIFDGGVYNGSDPFIGCSSLDGSWLGRLADKLIDDEIYNHVVIVPIGRGGSSITAWVPGGALNSHLTTAVARCVARGFSVTGVLWQQGEYDAYTSMSGATYQSHLVDVLGTIPGPWLIGKSTYVEGVTNSGIRAAYDAVVDNVSVFAGADTDLLTAVYRQGDNLHFNATGADAAATLWAAAIAAAL